MSVIKVRDNTGIQELSRTKVGRTVIRYTLNRLLGTVKAEGKRSILGLYTIRRDKVGFYDRKATLDLLQAEVTAKSSDPRGKKTTPLHDFSVRWTPTKGKKYTKGTPPPIQVEVVKGKTYSIPGGFLLKTKTGKLVAIRRRRFAIRDERPWSRTLFGPAVGQLFMNQEVQTNVERRVDEQYKKEIGYAIDRVLIQREKIGDGVVPD